MFNSEQKRVLEHHICKELDPSNRGYVELDDLSQAIEDHVTDKRVSLKINTIVGDHLEYRNKDSVYYSPLLGLPAPYFRHAGRIELFSVVFRMSQELTALDSHDGGFVPVGLFRSVLEHELKVKPKIVDDFIENCKQPVKSLDVNAQANSFQSQLDYIVLLRKLCQIAETRDSLAPEMTESEKTEVDEHEYMIVQIDIESGRQLRNPVNRLELPNAIVQLKQNQEVLASSDVRNGSCYPEWQSRGHEVRLQLPLLDKLEFDVSHRDGDTH